MDRRAALRTLGVLAPAPLVAAPSLLGREVVLCTTFVTGKAVVPDALPHALELDVPLRVEGGLNLPDDPNAVGVWAGEVCLGFIPRALAAIPANLLSQGQVLKARVVDFRPEAPFWERLQVEVLLAG